jgi:uroporphyrinogen-III decarboxylase
MDAVFALHDLDQPPIVVSSALFWVAGLDLETFPDAYFDDPEVMTGFQERAYFEQLQSIDDDFVPYLMPWFGTGVAASAFGCQIGFVPRQDPAVNPSSYPVQTAEDVRRLQIPNPNTDGLMPRVLEFQRYMKAHSFLPVGITDFQGPLTTANQLMGYDKLIYLMADDPTAAHELMDKVTEALILWVRTQKEVIGEPLTESAGGHQIYYGRNAGVWFSDDDAVIMSARSYREFVVPYNSRILQAFGGGSIHYCGRGSHQAENFLATRGLVAVNNYTLYNLADFHALKQKLEGRIAVFACDYTPVDYRNYFHELLDGLSRRGLVILSHYSPVLGLLRGGKYDAIRRDLYEGRRQVYQCLRNEIAGEHREHIHRDRWRVAP